MVTIFYALVGFGRLSILVRRATAAAPLVQHMKTVYRDASRDPKETLILQTYTNYLEKSVIFYSVIFMGGVVLTGFLPLAVYLWTGNKILPFGVVIPFVDPETPDGYQMNYMYQVSFMLWTPPGLIASQSFYFALSFNICIQFDVLVVKLQGVDNLIANNVNGSLDGEIRTNLITVIKYQQRLVQFISDLEDLYAFQTFLEVACNALQIVMTLFVLHIEFWFPGWLVITVSTFQLFLPCMLGTMIEIKCDLFIEQVYDISWHAMSNVEQKMLNFMLTKSQRTQKLSCVGMVPLNMNLFLAVYKKIYSIFMMLQNL
uniref:Putative odorant receptor n=1 Tax=Aedes albopictus TaxID=7160 RepID=A0A1W7R6N7_AEDAL